MCFDLPTGHFDGISNYIMAFLVSGALMEPALVIFRSLFRAENELVTAVTEMLWYLIMVTSFLVVRVMVVDDGG